MEIKTSRQIGEAIRKEACSVDMTKEYKEIVKKKWVAVDDIQKELSYLSGMIQRNVTLKASNYEIYKDKVTEYRNKLFEQIKALKKSLSTFEKTKGT